jgi:hypothetical protein
MLTFMKKNFKSLVRTVAAVVIVLLFAGSGSLQGQEALVVRGENFIQILTPSQFQYLIDQNGDLNFEKIVTEQVQSRFRQPGVTLLSGLVDCNAPFWIKMKIDNRNPFTLDAAVGMPMLSESFEVYLKGMVPSRVGRIEKGVVAAGETFKSAYPTLKIPLAAGLNEVYIRKECKIRYLPMYMVSSFSGLNNFNALISWIIGMLLSSEVLLFGASLAMYYFSRSIMFLAYKFYLLAFGALLYSWYGGFQLFGPGFVTVSPIQIIGFAGFAVEVSAIMFFWGVINIHRTVPKTLFWYSLGLFAAAFMMFVIFNNPLASTFSFITGFYLLVMISGLTLWLAWRGEPMAKVFIIMVIPAVGGFVISLSSILGLGDLSVFYILLMALAEIYGILLFSALIGYRLYMQQRDIEKMKATHLKNKMNLELSHLMVGSFATCEGRDRKLRLDFIVAENSRDRSFSFKHRRQKSGALVVVVGRLKGDSTSHALMTLGVKSWLATFLSEEEKTEDLAVLGDQVFEKTKWFFSQLGAGDQMQVAVLCLDDSRLIWRLTGEMQLQLTSQQYGPLYEIMHATAAAGEAAWSDFHYLMLSSCGTSPACPDDVTDLEARALKVMQPLRPHPGAAVFLSEIRAAKDADPHILLLTPVKETG